MKYNKNNKWNIHSYAYKYHKCNYFVNNVRSLKVYFVYYSFKDILGVEEAPLPPSFSSPFCSSIPHTSNSKSNINTRSMRDRILRVRRIAIFITVTHCAHEIAPRKTQDAMRAVRQFPPTTRSSNKPPAITILFICSFVNGCNCGLGFCPLNQKVPFKRCKIIKTIY